MTSPLATPRCSLTLADLDASRLTSDLLGKGSKPRRLPITSDTARHLGRYTTVFHPSPQPTAPLFYTVRNHRPTQMSDDNVARFVRQHAATAKATCPDVPARVHPHMLRHYVNGWVMWLARVFPLAAVRRMPIPAT
jgi:integrase